jgi:Short C-terminal domain
MLFLYRPRQTWTPYPPRQRTQQDQFNRHLQDTYKATRQVPPYVPDEGTQARDTVAQLKELAELHSSGLLNDSEFAIAKAKLLEPGE